MTNKLGESDEKHNNAIHDYFDIKYDTILRKDKLKSKQEKQNDTKAHNNENNLSKKDELDKNDGKSFEINSKGFRFDKHRLEDDMKMSIKNADDKLYQKWINNDVLQKESETDKYLEELKTEHGLASTNFTDNTKIVDKWTKKDEFPNISDIDLDELFKDETDKKFEKFFELDLQKLDEQRLEEKSEKSFSSDRQKLNTNKDNSKIVTSSKSSKTGVNKKTTTIKPTVIPKKPDIKPKFVATQVKGGKDCTDSSRHSPDIESWMAKSSQKPAEMKKANYLDFLNHISDIEEFEGPEHKTSKSETDGKISAVGSLDDIVSILEALENEDKKSRK